MTLTSTPTDPTTTAHQRVRVIRRDGAVSPFDPSKISVAMTKAFLAVEGDGAAASSRVHHVVAELTEQVEASLLRHAGPETALHIEQIQDLVELALMRGEHHKVARAYVLYREERARARQAAKPAKAEGVIHVRTIDGGSRPLDWDWVSHVVGEAVAGLDDVSAEPVLAEARRNLYDGISADELATAQIMAARTLVEQEPNYSYVSARLLLDRLRGEALSYLAGEPRQASQNEMATRYPATSGTTCDGRSSSNWSTQSWPPSTSPGSPRRSGPSVTWTSASSACRPSTTATSCTTTAPGSSCHRRSSCGWRWAWPPARTTGKLGRSRSASCCPRFTSWHRRRRCSPPTKPRTCTTCTAPRSPTGIASTRRQQSAVRSRCSARSARSSCGAGC